MPLFRDDPQLNSLLVESLPREGLDAAAEASRRCPHAGTLGSPACAGDAAARHPDVTERDDVVQPGAAARHADVGHDAVRRRIEATADLDLTPAVLLELFAVPPVVTLLRVTAKRAAAPQVLRREVAAQTFGAGFAVLLGGPVVVHDLLPAPREFGGECLGKVVVVVDLAGPRLVTDDERSPDVGQVHLFGQVAQVEVAEDRATHRRFVERACERVEHVALFLSEHAGEEGRVAAIGQLVLDDRVLDEPRNAVQCGVDVQLVLASHHGDRPVGRPEEGTLDLG